MIDMHYKNVLSNMTYEQIISIMRHCVENMPCDDCKLHDTSQLGVGPDMLCCSDALLIAAIKHYENMEDDGNER